MGTRGVIARAKGDGWEGRYHHWDSYPRGLGKTLWDLYHGFFNQDKEAMTKFLIDEHPAGWSTINRADFNMSAGYSEDFDPRQAHGPICYCHGERTEEPTLETDQTADPLFIEWVYVFGTNHHMAVFASKSVPALKQGQHGHKVEASDARYQDGRIKHTPEHYYVHAPVTLIDLDGPEPDWNAIEKMTEGE